MDGTEVTITEAAAAKSVSRSAIHQAIKTGRLAARVEIPPGGAQGTWLIKREDLDQWEPATPQERGRRGARSRYGKEQEQ